MKLQSRFGMRWGDFRSISALKTVAKPFLNDSYLIIASGYDDG